MSLPHTHLPANFLPPKALTDQPLSPFFSFPKTPKPSKFTIRSSNNSAIKRIADKLRSLGFTEEKHPDQPKPGPNSPGEIFVPLPVTLPKYRVGHTLDPSWSTPEDPLPQPGTGRRVSRFLELRKELQRQKRDERKAEVEPTLAGMTLSAAEMRRLQKLGIETKKKINVGKAGITEGIVNGIHENWRNSEIVKIVCEDLCRLNMKRTHDLLERKTGGMVVWRSGGKIVLYRGENYKYPYFLRGENDEDLTSDARTNDGGNESCPSSTDEMNSATGASPAGEGARPALVQGVGVENRFRFLLPGEAELAEEADRLLEGLGPRFTDWWGYEPLPVDADLLPAVVPGYRTPFRLLPYGMQPKLTDDEMTTIRRLARPLPCHFALGRNGNHQGLATSIIKLWEKCEIAKVAVKRGFQNTNSLLMAEELKRLTGGTLIARDREFIVLYRGKDYLPPAVSSAIEERRKLVINADKQMSGLRNKDDWTLPSEERKLKSTEAAKSRASIKLSMALQQREKAEKRMAELEKSEISQQAEKDKEGITEQERYMLRKIGLRMKAFLLLGKRKVFAGTIENMHLHWKYRELVKIITNEDNITSATQVAQILESESGGILVAVERVSKGYAIIVYRGKNYVRPASLRPDTLMTKREALKHSIEMQRRESLKLHVLELNRNIDELELQLVEQKGTNNVNSECESRIELVKEEVNNVQSEECLISNAELNYGSESVTQALDEDNIKAREKEESHATNMDMNDGMGCNMNSHVVTREDEQYYLSSSCDVGENDILFNDVKGEVGGLVRDRKKQECVNNIDRNDKIGAIMNIATQRDKDVNFSFTSDEDESGTVDPGFSYETVTNEAHANWIKDTNEEIGALIKVRDNHELQANSSRSSTVDNNQHQVSETMDLSGLSGNSESKQSVPVMVRKSLNEITSKAVHLSNSERLLLRKQALKMKKRPVLAVGKNNIVTGVAKTIKEHFKRHPLAIVNVKGRARGTSVREVVSKLEQATGAVLVSQEPTKVILYRGWGAGDSPGNKGKNANEKKVAPVSPELLAAIRLECGLQNHRMEDAAP